MCALTKLNCCHSWIIYHLYCMLIPSRISVKHMSVVYYFSMAFLSLRISWYILFLMHVPAYPSHYGLRIWGCFNLIIFQTAMHLYMNVCIHDSIIKIRGYYQGPFILSLWKLMQRDSLNLYYYFISITITWIICWYKYEYGDK